MAPPESALSPRLAEILQRLQDRSCAGRLKKVYVAAAHAIHRLSDMDLVKYETSAGSSSPDLSLWEEMAPVIRDTVMDVNAMLSVIRDQFPQNTPGGIADLLERAVEEVGGGDDTSESGRAQQAVRALHGAMQQIAVQVTELGEAMRSPSVVSDRWNLLSEIQRFRTRFREEIGDVVYTSISCFFEVNRKDVVPGYAEEVASAVTVRATVADLVRVTASRVHKIEQAEPEDVQWNAQQYEKELDLFGRTAAYQALRAQDKRAIIEFRQRLGEIASEPHPSKGSLVSAVAPFSEMVESLMQVNNRQMLMVHDREVLAASGVRLEQADEALRVDPQASARILGEATLSAQALYGRDSELDAFLRKARKTPLAGLKSDQLAQTLDEFRTLLAGLPL